MIYLDNHATTPCDPEVIKSMLPIFGELFGNPSSTIHSEGRKAADAVQEARIKVASLIGADAKEIIFTSGATESNNIAIQGLIRGNNGTRRKIVTTPIEHKAIINQCKALKKQGFSIVFLPVSRLGEVSLHDAEKEIDEDTLVVSIQTASNEIGTIQPIKELAEIAHAKGSYFHTDAAQAVGKIPINVLEWDIDLLSMSAHKLYGPKGVGALFIKGGVYSVPISPLVYGGEQENNLRSGTLNTPGIVGFGKACELCEQTIKQEEKRLASIRDLLERSLIDQLDVQINGSLDNRLPNNSSLTFRGIDADALIVNMAELAVSTGSACTSGAIEPSYVLQAIGLNRDDADSTIRIGLGRFNTEDEIRFAAKTIIQTVKKLLFC
jgi:cysteine desulfurase